MAYAAFEQLTDNFLWSNPWRRHSSATAADWWHRNSRPGMDSIPKLRSGALPLYSSGFGSAHTPKAKHDTSGDRTDTRAPSTRCRSSHWLTATRTVRLGGEGPLWKKC